jgi:N-acetylmuramoyl-L-alanine amidase
MRFLCLLLAVAACLAQAQARDSSPLSKDVRLAGLDYVAVGNWAQTHEFTTTWNRKTEELVLSSRWAKMAFKAGTRKAEINGITVWLSYPVYNLKGEPYIARADLNTLLQPVLFPPIPAARTGIHRIVLDPGHGGKDPGNQEGSQQEKHHTLLLAKEVQRRLGNAGLKVSLTRSTDTFIELDDRPDLARRFQADLFVSLHFNSAPESGTGAKGIEVYCLTPAGANSTHSPAEAAERHSVPGNRYDPQNILLAYEIQKSILKELTVEDRGVLRARWAVLRTAQMPAVLIEGGFMSDPKEARKIYSESYRRQLAQAIVDGVLAYKRLVERPQSVAASKKATPSPTRSAKPAPPSAPRVEASEKIY